MLALPVINGAPYRAIIKTASNIASAHHPSNSHRMTSHKKMKEPEHRAGFGFRTEGDVDTSFLSELSELSGMLELTRRG